MFGGGLLLAERAHSGSTAGASQNSALPDRSHASEAVGSGFVFVDQPPRDSPVDTLFQQTAGGLLGQHAIAGFPDLASEGRFSPEGLPGQIRIDVNTDRGISRPTFKA